ncbi:hypothetical protein ACFLV3_06320 [Chloroflexota bacterium]
MKKNRVFTDEELKEMGKILRDSIVEAIEAGDKEKAKELLDLMYDDAKLTVSFFSEWVTVLLDYVYVNCGEKALEETLRNRFGISEAKRIESYPKMDLRNQVKSHVAGLRKLFQKMEIEEDDEKVCIKMAPCGSGQLLVESGVYGPPWNLSRMKPGPLTWGTSDFPIYCAHGAVQEILAIEKLGRPLYVHWFPPKVATESCRFCFYKDINSVPEEVYTRVGKKKPNEP